MVKINNTKKSVKTSLAKSKKTSKSSSKSTVLKTNKSKKDKTENKPSLESILDDADRAFTDIVKKYMTLGETLVKAITYYGSAGKRAFKMRFPLTDNSLNNLELVGRGRLLPQFAMCSNRFVKGLVDMVDSLKWQYKLIGASKCGIIRVRINGNIINAKLTDLRSEKLVDGVLSIISDENKDLTPKQLCEKLMSLRKEVRANFNREVRPTFEIATVDGRKCIRFLKAKPFSADDLRKFIAKLEA